MRDPRERLEDILDASAAIARYHDRDELLQSWYLRHLQIIGEADRALPDEVRGMAPGVPWSEIIGARRSAITGH